MATLDTLYSQLNYYYQQQAAYIEQRRQVQNKINRLKTAKNKVNELKNDARDVRKSIEKKPGEYDDRWQGKEYNWLVSKTGGSLKSSLEQYWDDIDAIQDDMADAVRDLENENRNLGVVLNGICNSINYLTTEIEKFFN